MNDDDKRRRDYLLLLLALMRRFKKRLMKLGVWFAAGELDNNIFRDEFEAVMAGSIAHANAIGYTLARAQTTGDWSQEPTISPSDMAAAVALIQMRRKYLDEFIADVQGGRYTDDQGSISAAAVSARSAMYVGTAYYSANRTWLNSLPSEMLIYWNALPGCCDGCSARQEGGPYTRASLPGIPGDGSTPCMMNCRCSISTDTGAVGPQMIDEE